MKKFPRKFQYPLMISMVLPTMLLTMPAIVTFKRLPPEGGFVDLYLEVLGQLLPPALLVFAVVAPIARLFVTKVLLEPINNEQF